MTTQDQGWALTTSDLPALWSTTRRWWLDSHAEGAEEPPPAIDLELLRDIERTLEEAGMKVPGS